MMNLPVRVLTVGARNNQSGSGVDAVASHTTLSALIGLVAGSEKLLCTGFAKAKLLLLHVVGVQELEFHRHFCGFTVGAGIHRLLFRRT
jgi:hypothetical protein